VGSGPSGIGGKGIFHLYQVSLEDSIDHSAPPLVIAVMIASHARA
jgi:hypothetical protein